MRKISIARRRIETIDNKQRHYSAIAADSELLPFRRSNEATARLLNITSSKSHSSYGSDASGIIEVDLNSRQIASVNPLLKAKRQIQVNGTLDRDNGGVLLLNLNLSGDKIPKYVSAKTIAGMLEISPRTVYRMHKENRLSGIKMGRTLRFLFRDVLDYLGSCAEGSEG